MFNSECLFCKIAVKLVPAEVVYEDERTIAFLDIHPRTEGHTIVISKHHCPVITDLPDSEVDPLFRAVKRVADLAMRAMQADGLTIGVNHGYVSGQAVDHLHVHVLPRFSGDGGGSIHSVVDRPARTPIPEVAQKFRNLQNK